MKKQTVKRSIITALALVLVLCMAQGALWAAAAEPTIIDVTSYGANGADKADDADAFQNAFDRAKTEDGIEVHIPAGTYYLSKRLSVYSNTRIIATGATMILNGSVVNESGSILVGRHLDDYGVMCQNNSSCKHGGYTQAHDIYIDGGIWDRNDINGKANSSVISVHHGKNITLKNLTVKNGTSHLINLSGDDGVVVDNVTFTDSRECTNYDLPEFWATYTPGDKVRYRSVEVLHLDFVNSADEPGKYPADDTPTKNVKVTNCTFQNVFAGIGTHHVNTATPGSNIVIQNNTFKNINGVCVNASNYQGVKATNNTADKALNFVYSNKSEVTISDNTITNSTGVAIMLTNGATGSTTGNKITNSELSAIRMDQNSAQTITSNIITTTKDCGISATNGCNVIAKNNTISGAATNGIRTSDSSAQIEGNTIKDSDSNGIYVIGASKPVIKGNTIANVGNGIIVSKCSNSSIASNKITNCSKTAILVEEGNKNQVTSNTVTTANVGLYFHNTSGDSATDNIVKGCASHACYINGETIITAVTIQNNTLYSKASTTKAVRLKGKVNGTKITNNKVSDGGIYADDGCSFTASGNSVAKPSDNNPTANEGTGITIANMSKYNNKTVDYKTTITFHAKVEKNTGNDIEWYVNGKKAGKGEAYTVSKATTSYTIYCQTKAADGSIIKSETETINVKGGFFAALVAFFKGLFNSLPVFDQ